MGPCASEHRDAAAHPVDCYTSRPCTVPYRSSALRENCPHDSAPPTWPQFTKTHAWSLAPHLVRQEVLAMLIPGHLQALEAVLEGGWQPPGQAPGRPVPLAQQLRRGAGCVCGVERCGEVTWGGVREQRRVTGAAEQHTSGQGLRSKSSGRHLAWASHYAFRSLGMQGPLHGPGHQACGRAPGSDAQRHQRSPQQRTFAAPAAQPPSPPSAPALQQRRMEWQQQQQHHHRQH